ncbi:hypothetical protein [Occultella gossypii]|uniref:Hydroxylaminobenzene mutase n=1 Tax=Occultella gossypii TaxID=2800820 RepID=A0ABS7S3I3_9MICO|nr:hypothetical protein [Occultella gossypii]MBZ2194909.1 hypothetical protein [Occultella gossypii]
MTRVRTLLDMEELKSLNWPFILGLGALGLVGQLGHLIGVANAMGEAPFAIVHAAVVSVAWIVLVGFSTNKTPILTSVLAAMAYGVYTIVIGATVLPITTGGFESLSTMAIAILPVIGTNAAWGLITGLIARGIQTMRGRKEAR